jgi:Ca-activated chloride channel homolog
MAMQAKWMMVSWMLAACATNPSVRTTTQTATVAAHHTIAVANNDPSTWLHASPVRTRIVQNSDGTTWVGFWVDTPAATHTAQRAPLDVALVVDTSGSMSGEKIQNARIAAASFVDGLSEGDMVSLYTFNDQVTELAPPTIINSATRTEILSRVQRIFASGGTNLHDGLLAGRMATDRAPDSHPVRRIVVISDGRATVGNTNPASIADIASQATEHGAQVTSIGVGIDYDEGMLNTVAIRSAGRLYHLLEPQQMDGILHGELELLGETVAANVFLEFTPMDGVTVEDGANVRLDRRGNTVRVPLGSLYGSQHREVLLRVRIPTSGETANTLGEVRMTWQEPNTTEPHNGTPVAMRYEFTQDAQASEASTEQRVQAMVVSWEATQAQMRATQLLNQGQAERAEQELRQAEVRLQQAQQQYHFSDDVVQGSMRRQSEGMAAGRAAAGEAARAPAAARPARMRAAALQNNSSAMDSSGY